VKSHSENEVWDRVRDAERQFGDEAEATIAQRIHELTAAREFDEASFWSAVAARLKDLHSIRFPEKTVLPALLDASDHRHGAR
jgi:hypothetical protein